ncbi:MAG: hypothetical protein QOE11_793 [Solirubrobacteraceae bacterium]|jgi:hypothetical protein|nr:hypothetical protein [Solirubrobacteraceae bacterium]
MSLFATTLEDAGGTAAPRERSAQLRALLRDELARSQAELGLARSGREEPVTVVIAALADALVAVLPVPVALRADPGAAPERAWLTVAAATGALVEIAQLRPPRGPGDLVLEAGSLEGHLALRLPTDAEEDAELAAVAFDEHVAPVARLRARALALPGHVLSDAGDWRAPIAPALRSAEAVARLGGRPADGDSVAALEESALAILAPAGAGAARPHDDPDPARRIARRILQRLNGMGKWGGYHTDFSHLARGFAGNERALADAVGESLLDAGLLSEKPSVGQRHVYLNPRRAADIHRLIESGELPAGLRLP